MTEKHSEHSYISDSHARYKVAGESRTSSVDNRARKEIRLSLPLYTQTFDVTTILEVPHMRAAVLGQPYRIYSSDNKIIDEGVMSEVSGTARTASSMLVRCEIGTGNWTVVQDSYDYEDIEKLLADPLPIRDALETYKN